MKKVENIKDHRAYEKFKQCRHGLATQVMDRYDSAFAELRGRALTPVERAHIDCAIALPVCGKMVDVKRLLSFDDVNFMHDVDGFIEHYDIVGSDFADCWEPRCGYENNGKIKVAEVK